jgi:hypothetical protein
LAFRWVIQKPIMPHTIWPFLSACGGT